MSLFFFLLLSTVAIDARVIFDNTQVLDNVDLQGTNSVAFPCFFGCRVYSPTKNDKLVIQGIDGQEFINLQVLAGLKQGEFFELPHNNKGYKLVNKGPPNPSFILYVPEKKGESDFYTEVAYVDASSNVTATSNGPNSMIIILSATGSIRFSDFKGNYSVALPSVYTTGFDEAKNSQPVYTASSPALALKTAFSVYSPIATIDFKRPGDQSVFVTGDSTQSSMAQDSSAVYVSPGYVGCYYTGDALYTLIPDISNIDASVSLSRPAGLSVAIRGDYSIADQSDNLELNVNSEDMILVGKNRISKKYDNTLFTVKLDWSKKEGSKDGFAMQIDITSK